MHYIRRKKKFGAFLNFKNFPMNSRESPSARNFSFQPKIILDLINYLLNHKRNTTERLELLITHRSVLFDLNSRDNVVCIFYLRTEKLKCSRFGHSAHVPLFALARFFFYTFSNGADGKSDTD